MEAPTLYATAPSSAGARPASAATDASRDAWPPGLVPHKRAPTIDPEIMEAAPQYAMAQQIAVSRCAMPQAAPAPDYAGVRLGAPAADARSGAPPAGAAQHNQQQSRLPHATEILCRLSSYLRKRGGSPALLDGWHAYATSRSDAATSGRGFDVYYISPGGKRFRSRSEIANFFQLNASPAVAPAADSSGRTLLAAVPAALRGKRIAKRTVAQHSGSTGDAPRRMGDSSSAFSAASVLAAAAEAEEAQAMDQWIQCDRCNKWRRIPPEHTAPVDDADQWVCERVPGLTCDHDGA